MIHPRFDRAVAAGVRSAVDGLKRRELAPSEMAPWESQPARFSILSDRPRI
ncbi:hypothetical protein [Limnothrix sp. PR1529]|uniref:hypothetical protein n=1 Tax=Limnothrix sp. PR1529 TaxID=1704291 RepID=UPI0013040D6B|nr:hypothetical protein [Limnothrix sp. PR1529]